MTKIIGFALLVVGASASLMAVQSVPEIGAATGGSALALVAGALLIMRGRRTK